MRDRDHNKIIAEIMKLRPSKVSFTHHNEQAGTNVPFTTQRERDELLLQRQYKAKTTMYAL